MQEYNQPEPQPEPQEDKPVDPQHEDMPVFSIGNVTVVVTE